VLLPAAEPGLPSICDVQESAGSLYFRLSDTRLLAWLALKMRALSAALLAGESAASFAAYGEKAMTAYAAGLLGEWLPASVLSRLQTHLGVADSEATIPALPLPIADTPALKKAKPSKVEEANARAKERMKASNTKAAAGTKGLASFFTKKT